MIEEMNKEIAAEKEKLVCPLCRGTQWRISDKVFQVLEYEPNGLGLGSATVPILPLTCMNCGNTYFINTLVSKLIDRPSEEGKNGTSKKTQDDVEKE